MTVTICLIIAAACSGAALGLVLGGILGCGKAEDSYRAGYERGLAEGNPFDVRVGRDLAEIEQRYRGAE